MKTMIDQLTGKCVHFNGIMNDVCKAGVNYMTNFGPTLHSVIPCLKGGTGSCSLCQFPTEEEAKAKEAKMREGTLLTLKAYAAVQEHIQKALAENRPKPFKGTITCPNGDHKLHFQVAMFNGHIAIACETCGISARE